jgi:Ca2+-binding EF-hand superfamily protein
MSIKEAFKLMDSNNDGFVNQQEFMEGIDKLMVTS